MVTGAIVLLAALVLNVNRSLLKSTDQTIEAEAIIAATSAGQQVIDMISSKEFDENTIGTYIEDISNFTASGSLGPETGELSVTTYDDIDDFNGFLTSIQTPRMGLDTVRVSVSYVNPASPGTASSSRTRMKKIEAAVISPYLPDTLKLYYYSSH